MTTKERTTRMLLAVHDAPQKAPWFAAPIGLLALGYVGYVLVMTRAMGKLEYGVAAFGLCCLPGFLPYLTRNAQSALRLYRSYRKTDK